MLTGKTLHTYPEAVNTLGKLSQNRLSCPVPFALGLGTPRRLLGAPGGTQGSLVEYVLGVIAMLRQDAGAVDILEIVLPILGDKRGDVVIRPHIAE